MEAHVFKQEPTRRLFVVSVTAPSTPRERGGVETTPPKGGKEDEDDDDD